MSALLKLGEFAAGHRPDERTRAAARLHVADTIGAWIAGLATAEGRALTTHRAKADERINGDIATHCGSWWPTLETGTATLSTRVAVKPEACCLFGSA